MGEILAIGFILIGIAHFLWLFFGILDTVVRIANAAETLSEIATMQWHCSHGNCPYDVKENGGGHKCSQQAPDVVN